MSNDSTPSAKRSTRQIKSDRHTVGYQMRQFLERFGTKDNESQMYQHLLWLIKGIQEGERTEPNTNNFSTPHDIKP